MGGISILPLATVIWQELTQLVDSPLDRKYTEGFVLDVTWLIRGLGWLAIVAGI
jgi:hypothetical protein